VSLAEGLAAALLLARGRPEGLALLPPAMESALFSFRAALLCLPAFLGLRLLDWSMGEAPRAGIPVALAAEATGFVAAWAGFALASHAMCITAGRQAHWPRFIAAWNWTNLVQYAVLVAVAVPSMTVLPGWAADALGIVTLGYVLWLVWFVARQALEVPGATAVLFVLLDLALGLFTRGFTARISGG